MTVLSIRALSATAWVLLMVADSAVASELEEPPRPWTVELALFPVFTQQQIEGPARDDRVVNEAMLGVVANATYAALDWLDAGLYLHFDVGSSERTTWSRPDSSGVARVDQRIDGAFFELWAAIFARARWGPGFFELGWAPLIVRHDSSRVDLPNASGATDGDFLGSRSVAFLAAGGARVPLAERLLLTLRLELRIRYLVDRGGEPLADDEEFGQMAAWPFIGLAYRF